MVGRRRGRARLCELVSGRSGQRRSGCGNRRLTQNRDRVQSGVGGLARVGCGHGDDGERIGASGSARAGRGEKEPRGGRGEARVDVRYAGGHSLRKVAGVRSSIRAGWVLVTTSFPQSVQVVAAPGATSVTALESTRSRGLGRLSWSVITQMGILVQETSSTASSTAYPPSFATSTHSPPPKPPRRQYRAACSYCKQRRARCTWNTSLEACDTCLIRSSA